MGVLDKFMDIMKLNDDDDYDDDFYDDEYDDEYEEKPKRSFFRKEKNYNDYDDEEEEYNPPARTSRNSRSGSNSKITPMRQPARRASNVSMEVCVIRPTSVEDAREITETLLDGRTVILNLEGLDLEGSK